MKKTAIYTFSLKKNLLSILFVLFTISLVCFSKSNLEAAKSGLSLWANSVVPALFPFFVATELLTHTEIISFLGKKLNRFMKPFFNIPGEGSFALIMGIISGYPVGAKIVTKFREEGTCSKEEAERLLAFTNNSGPLFILGTVGISLFSDTSIGILLLLTHILACLTVGFFFRFWKKEKCTKTALSSSKIEKEKITCTFSNLGEVLSLSIMQAVSTIVMIGGFIVIFSVVLSILNQSHIIGLVGNAFIPIFEFLHINPNFILPTLNGFLELTNGVKQISLVACPTLSINIILCAFLLGFGGISVLLQVFSIVSKTDISIFPYFLGKLLQGLFAAFYTFIAFKLFPFLTLDLVPVFANQTSPHVYQDISHSILFIIGIFVLLSCFILYRKKKQIRS